MNLREDIESKAKPILFNPEMVGALLDDRKTQTRRPLKPANPKHAADMGGYWPGNGLWVDGYSRDGEPNNHVKDYSVSDIWFEKSSYIERYSKYRPGDFLYVQETWRVTDCDAKRHIMTIEMRTGDWAPYEVQFTPERFAKFEKFAAKNGWQSPYFLPREAARIFLKVDAVVIEALQSITAEQIVYEGVWVDPPPAAVNTPAKPLGYHSWNKEKQEDWVMSMARSTYIAQCDHIAALLKAWRAVWDSTVSKEDMDHYGWEADPWVWVYDFSRII